MKKNKLLLNAKSWKVIIYQEFSFSNFYMRTPLEKERSKQEIVENTVDWEEFCTIKD